MTTQQYAKLARSMDAVDAVPFSIEQIVFDPRTLLKCMFGCRTWGKNHTCPSRPGNPGLADYKDMFSRYREGVIIHTHDKVLSQQISFAIEDQAFKDGHYLAFSLSDCALCAGCGAAEGVPCRNPHMARPAFHSVGIDVFKTVRQLGLPIETLTDPESEEQNWYSAVFIE